ncbi:MAG: DUF3127 domain-containing protein [Bacteroidales bacterium]
MSLEITGRLIQKLELQSGVGKTGNSWQKQEFVIETIEQYPKKICANLWGDKIEMLSPLNVGDTVMVSFALESREFNGKWYTDVKAWKIERPAAAPANAPKQNTSSASVDNFPEEFATFIDEGVDDGLPF